MLSVRSCLLPLFLLLVTVFNVVSVPVPAVKIPFICCSSFYCKVPFRYYSVLFDVAMINKEKDSANNYPRLLI